MRIRDHVAKHPSRRTYTGFMSLWERHMLRGARNFKLVHKNTRVNIGCYSTSISYSYLLNRNIQQWLKFHHWPHFLLMTSCKTWGDRWPIISSNPWPLHHLTHERWVPRGHSNLVHGVLIAQRMGFPPLPLHVSPRNNKFQSQGVDPDINLH